MIIAKLKNMEQKRKIMIKKNLKDKNIFMNDLTWKERQVQKEICLI